MPYRHAWIFIAALIAASVFAFWRTYFGIMSTASFGFHAHGVTAASWLLLLLAQSWTPHHRMIALHRTLGLATFAVIPLFAAGAMGVIHSMSAGTVGGDPFYAMWGARLAFIDLLAFGALLYAAGMALRYRRNVRLHAGYMLSTVLPLVAPVLGRIINQTMPGLIIRGPQDFPLFGWGVQLANGCVMAFTIWLWRREPRFGRPWAVASAVIAAQIVGFETLAVSRPWIVVVRGIATQPLAASMTVGLIAGMAVVAIGWTRSMPRGGRPLATA